MIVTVTPTIMDGTVVRWYTSRANYERNADVASASRNRAVLPDPLDPVWEQIEADVNAAHEQLRRNPDADLSHLATHRKRGIFGPLEEIKKVSADG